MTNARKRVYAFLSLPSHVQYARVEALGLIQEGDFNRPDPELIVAWAKRAKDKGVVEQLFLIDEQEEA